MPDNITFQRTPAGIIPSGSPIWYQIGLTDDYTNNVPDPRGSSLVLDVSDNSFAFDPGDTLTLYLGPVTIFFIADADLSVSPDAAYLPSIATAGSKPAWVIAARAAMNENYAIKKYGGVGGAGAFQIQIVCDERCPGPTAAPIPGMTQTTNPLLGSSLPEGYHVAMTVELITSLRTIPCGEVKAYPTRFDEFVTFNLRDIVHGRLPRAPWGVISELIPGSIAILRVKATNGRMTVNPPYHINYRSIQTHEAVAVIGGEIAQEVFQDSGFNDLWSLGQLAQKWLTQQPLTRYTTRTMRMQYQFIALSPDILVYIRGIHPGRGETPADYQLVTGFSGVSGAGRLLVLTGIPDITENLPLPIPADWIGYTIEARRAGAEEEMEAPILTFMFRESCGDDRILHFRNSLEAFDTVRFTTRAEVGLEVSKDLYVTGSLDHAPQGFIGRFAPRDQVGVVQAEARESITVRSEFVTEQQMRWLRELLTSDEVYEDTYEASLAAGQELYPNNLRPVVIRPGSVKWYNEQAASDMYQLEVTYEYAGYQNQHYRGR